MRNNTVRSGLFFLLAGLGGLLASCAMDPLEGPGPYEVRASGPMEVHDPLRPGQPLRAEIYSPVAAAGARCAEDRFPGVLFMHGFGATYRTYDMYIQHMASHGFVVAGMNFRSDGGLDGRHDDLARQAILVIDHLLSEDSSSSVPVDASRLAAAGHSLGGKIAFYAASLDPRISVVMALDPSNGGGAPCFISDAYCNAYPVAPNIVTGDPGRLRYVNAASFIMRAAPDPFNPDPQSNAEYFFYGDDGAGGNAVGSPALYFDTGQAGHASWLYLGNPHIPRISRRTMVAWLNTHLLDQDQEAYFTGEVAQEDLAAGNLVGIATR